MESSTVEQPDTSATLSTIQHPNPQMAQEYCNKSAIHRALLPESHRRSIKTRTQLKNITSDANLTGDCNGTGDGAGEGPDEKAEVEKKIVALQKIVPGGETLAVDNLFEETAEYIMTLQYQIKVLRFLASFVEGSELQKRKFGG